MIDRETLGGATMGIPRKKKTSGSRYKTILQTYFKKCPKPKLLTSIYEWFEDRDKMFNRIIKDLDFRLTSYGGGSLVYGSFCNKDNEVTMIMKVKKSFFFNKLENTIVMMPEKIVLKKDGSSYRITPDGDNTAIRTFTEGENRLRKLLRDYKKCLDELKIKALEEDF